MMNTAIAPEETALVCANIGPRERQKRLIIGGVGELAALAGVGILKLMGMPWWVSAITLPLFFTAAIGFYQWRDKTCVANVMRGVSNMDDGDVDVTDEAMKAALAAQGRRVQIKSLVVAVGQTAVAMFVSAL